MSNGTASETKTWDYAKRDQTTYKATGFLWSDDEPHEVGGGEYEQVRAAKLVAVTHWLRKGATEFTIWRGTYVEDPIDDEEHGLVLDATWTQDDNWIINGHSDGTGGIEWEEESW